MGSALFHFYDHEALTEIDDANVDVTGGEWQEYQLLDKTYADKILVDQPFFAFYEGLARIDVDDTGVYLIELLVRHTLSDGTTIDSTRDVAARIARNAEVTIPLSVYNSVTEVPSGVYTDDQLANVNIELILRIRRENDDAWTLDMFESMAFGVTFYQFIKNIPGVVQLPPFQPPDYEPASTLKSRIDDALETVYTKAPDWDKPVIGRNQQIRSFSVRYEGTVTNSLGYQVPQCTVRYWVTTQSHTDPLDVEQEINMLTAYLDAVADCYPEQEDIEVSYETAGDARRSKYIVAEVVCNGA